jgi:hypothetical protein
MQTPRVTEISALSAHRREVALVRWSPIAVPEGQRRELAHGSDLLRSPSMSAPPGDRSQRGW